MKKCPQCNSVYTDDTQYCLNDGQVLISEILPLPSQSGIDDEEITVIRSEPMVVDLSGADAPNDKTLEYQMPPQNEIVPVKTKSGAKNYVVFLIIGLLLGGGLVLATLFLAKNFYKNDAVSNTNTSSAQNSNQSQKNGESKNTNSQANKQITAGAEHLEKTGASDEEFNGRVISLNAYVRSSPSRNSDEIAVLPVDDRLTITTRDNPNSPWFHVVCEHGTSGWMHGNTIEFTR